VLWGDLVLLPRVDKGAGADAWFRRAFEIARELDARMMQLRAAIGLCRSQPKQGETERGTRLLSEVYETFTEGFTTPDLIEAGELLERSQAHRP
jgi:hypothetical protein